MLRDRDERADFQCNVPLFHSKHEALLINEKRNISANPQGKR